MFSSTNTSNNNPKSYKLFTGLSAFEVLAVNPPKHIIEDLIGKPYPVDVSYNAREIMGRMVRPIVFWLKSKETGVVDKIMFNIGLMVDKANKSGSVRYISQNGDFKYLQQEDSRKNDYVRPAYVGEYDLYTFIQKLVGFKPNLWDANNNKFIPNPAANWLDDIVKNNITIEELYAGNIVGLEEVVKYANQNGRTIGLVLEVREKEISGQTGPVTLKIQSIITKPDTFYELWNGSITKAMITNFEKQHNTAIAGGYKISNGFYTSELMEYNSEKVLNKPAKNPDIVVPAWTM